MPGRSGDRSEWRRFVVFSIPYVHRRVEPPVQAESCRRRSGLSARDGCALEPQRISSRSSRPRRKHATVFVRTVDRVGRGRLVATMLSRRGPARRPRYPTPRSMRSTEIDVDFRQRNVPKEVSSRNRARSTAADDRRRQPRIRRRSRRRFAVFAETATGAPGPDGGARLPETADCAKSLGLDGDECPYEAAPLTFIQFVCRCRTVAVRDGAIHDDRCRRRSANVVLGSREIRHR